MNDRIKSKIKQVEQEFQQAYSAHEAGQFEQAKRLYLQVLRSAPGDMETLYLLGTACSQTRDFKQAATYLKKALKLRPKHVETLNNLGLTMKGMEKTEEALDYYRRALALKPAYADAHNNAGNVFEFLGRLDEAEPHIRRALELEPDHADAMCNLGLVMKGRDRFEEAAQWFMRSLELRPDHAISHDFLGSIYKIWGRLDDALVCLNRAVELSPDTYSPRNNRGAILEDLGYYDAALLDYQRAHEIEPDVVAARWNQAFLFLRQGMLERGWKAHEERLERDGPVSVRFPYPQWDGASLEGKTILVYAEQGLGDEILFASCIPDLLPIAGHCIIECAPRLEALFRRSFPSATVIGADRMQIEWLLDVPRIDVQIAIGSLPRFLRPSIDSFPARSAYLVPDAGRLEHWRARVALFGPGLKVGICWRSGLTTGERKKLYSDLSQWGEVFGIPGVHFVNLQYGECGAELQEARERFGVPITVFDDIDLRNDIDDAAALTASMDLVIAAPTAVLESAGALGVPAFSLNSYGKEWVQLGQSGFSPWHPNTRFIEQTVNGDWDTQLALAATELRAMIDGDASPAAYVALASGGELAVNPAFDDMAHYVLLEQQRWFDAEFDFVLALAAGQRQALDVGAAIGACALPLARHMPGGRVHAYSARAEELNLLVQSRRRNDLEAQLSIAIAGHEFSLDTQMDQHGLDRVDFVHLSQEMATAALMERGARFFTVNSPLVMFGVGAGPEFDAAVADWLLAHDYLVYRLIPGLGLLAPTASTDQLDAYTRYLFACKPERAARLEQQGVLAQAPHVLEALPGIDQRFWQHYLGALPYAGAQVQAWEGTGHKDPDWEVYWMALNLFALAKSGKGTAAERLACLQAAQQVLGALMHERPNLARLVSLCRIMSELGMREQAVAVLNEVCELLDAGMGRALDEPWLALSDQCAAASSANSGAQWVVGMILAQREHWRAFSTWFTGFEALPALLEARALGYGTDLSKRAIALISARYTQQP